MLGSILLKIEGFFLGTEFCGMTPIKTDVTKKAMMTAGPREDRIENRTRIVDLEAPLDTNCFDNECSK